MTTMDEEQGTSPILLRRRLANELRRLREASGLTLGQAAAELCCSPSKLSRLETCQVGAAVSDVNLLLNIYNVNAHKRNALLTMARQARRKENMWREYRNAPDVYKLISLERTAELIRIYHSALIPGLLQVEKYARSTISVVLPQLSDEEIERHVRLRVERQRLLSVDSPPTLHVILDEATLRRLEGTPHTLHEQVRHLIEATEMANVTLQFIPFAVGLYGGLEGPFRIFTFRDAEDVDLVHLEHPSGEIYLQNPDQVAKYCSLFDQLRLLALSPADSVRFLHGVQRSA